MSPKITWISSYPKSGNTMVRLFLASYFFTKDGILNNFEPLKNISAFNNYDFYQDIIDVPKIDHFIKKPEDVSKFWLVSQTEINKRVENDTIFLKTHNALVKYNSNFFTNTTFTKCFFYIVRDPRSVLISSMKHYGNISQNDAKFQLLSDKRITFANLQNRMPEFLLSWRANFVSWHNFNKTNPGLGIIIKYEDLVLNKEKTFKVLLNFFLKKINQEINVAKFEQSLNSINFERLQKIEKEKSFVEKSNKSEFFF